MHDLIVIGGGPGGYTAAIRGAQLGLNVGLVERESALGGTCLRVGCIPSKALLESSYLYHLAREKLHRHGVQVSGVELNLAAMLRRKDEVVATLCKGIDGLMKKNKITRYLGAGQLLGEGRVAVHADGKSQEISARHIVLATGSQSAGLRGVELDGRYVVTSTEAIAFDVAPNRLAVIGAGFIGLELGSVWSRLGAKVTVLEYLDRILPGADGQIAREAQKIFARQGIEFRLSAKVTGAKAHGPAAEISLEGGEKLTADRVLVAVGRKPYTEGLGLANVGIQLDKRGFIPVDKHFATEARDIYAIGDCIGGAMLAHKAENEGAACVEHIVTGYGHVNYDAIPAVTYTHPEIAQVGRTEEQLIETNVQYRTGTFAFRGNGRARTIDDIDGMVKILADSQTDRILGVHILGPQAGELIGECAAAMEFSASAEDLARTCHAHPTLSEAVREAALAVAGRAIHA